MPRQSSFIDHARVVSGGSRGIGLGGDTPIVDIFVDKS